jgi:hypothetical protein
MMKQKAVLASFILLTFPTAASAASVVWSQVSPSVFSMTLTQTAGVVSLIMNLEHPGVSVTYHANAYKLDDYGQKARLLYPSDSLPVGTKVLFTFPADSQFSDADIVWYATGSAIGTPYGQWVPGSGDARNGACNGQPYATNVPIIHPSYNGTPGNPLDNTAGGTASEYALLSIAPPGRYIGVSGPVSCTDAANGDKTCTLTGEGTVSATYTFNATQANFFGGMYYNFTRQDFIDPSYGQTEGCRDFGELEPAIIVPQQTIAYRIAVVQPSDPPMAPTVTSSASCTVGTPVTLTLNSSDPASHQLKYGVDWDANGSVDQWVPTSGYVNSGTSQSASRTYAIAGSKTVKVIAQNDQGTASAWTTFSFDCDNMSISCPIGYVAQNGACIFSACPAGYHNNGSDQCVVDEAACTAAPYCDAANEKVLDGCTGDVIEKCQYGCADGACKSVQPPTATLSAVPSLVKRDSTTVLSWSSQYTTVCTVSGTNGDSWTGLIGSETSSPIHSQVTYTVNCTGEEGADPSSVQKSVIVNIAPTFEEK